jgi:hypothetical protein
MNRTNDHEQFQSWDPFWGITRMIDESLVWEFLGAQISNSIDSWLAA